MVHFRLPPPWAASHEVDNTPMEAPAIHCEKKSAEAAKSHRFLSIPMDRTEYLRRVMKCQGDHAQHAQHAQRSRYGSNSPSWCNPMQWDLVESCGCRVCSGNAKAKTSINCKFHCMPSKGKIFLSVTFFVSRKRKYSCPHLSVVPPLTVNWMVVGTSCFFGWLSRLTTADPQTGRVLGDVCACHYLSFPSRANETHPKDQ